MSDLLKGLDLKELQELKLYCEQLLKQKEQQWQQVQPQWKARLKEMDLQELQELKEAIPVREDDL